MGKGAMGLEMLVWRQATPRWTNNHVWWHDSVNRRVAREGAVNPPRQKTGGGRRRAERVKKSA